MEPYLATFATPRRELLGIPDTITGRGMRIAIVDSIFPAHPDLVEMANREIQWLDARCQRFNVSQVVEASQGKGQHGLARATVAGGSGQSSAGRYCGVAPECDMILLNMRVISGKIATRPTAIKSFLERIVQQAASLGIRAIEFGSAGARTGPLVPWQWDGQRRCCEQLASQGVVVVSGTGNCPGSFSPTSLSPSALAGGGLTLPASIGSPVGTFHSPEGVTFEGKAVPEYCAPAERVVTPSVRLGEVCGISGIPAGHTIQEGMSFGDPFMLGFLACVWEKYPDLDARSMRLAVAKAAKSVSPRFGRHQVGMPTWNAMVQAVESLLDTPTDEPTPFERYAEVQEMSWKERITSIRVRPEQASDILLNSLPNPAPSEHRKELVAMYHRCHVPRTRAGIVLLLMPPEGSPAAEHPLLDEALCDESPLVLGCALDAMRRQPFLAEKRPTQLTRLINHPNGQVRYEALLAAEAGPHDSFVRPLIEGMQRDLDDGPLIAFFARRRCLKAITGETLFPDARKMLPGECVYSDYWMGKQRQCMKNWRQWIKTKR